MLRLSILAVMAFAAFATSATAADEGSAVYAALQSQLEGVDAAANGLEAELDTLNSRAFAQQSASGTAAMRGADWLDVGGTITYRVEASNRRGGPSQSLLFDLQVYTQLAPGVGMSLQLGNRPSRGDMLGGRGKELYLKRAYLHITD